MIVDAVRTPRGKATPGGGLSGVTALEMLTQLLQALEARSRFDSSTVDDVIIGCATQTGEQGGNLAKTAALMAGWDHGVPGVTINRFCTSGLDAIGIAAAKIGAGMADLIVAGGVESVSRVPMYADQGPLYSDRAIADVTGGGVFMGIAADLVATIEGFERHELDAYGVALGLGLTRQPPLSPRTMQTLAWCTAAQLPTMLTLLFDLEGNRNPKKWTPTDRMTVDRSQRPEPRRTEPDAS